MHAALAVAFAALLFASPAWAAPSSPYDPFRAIALQVPKPPEQPVCCLKPLPPLDPVPDDILLSFEEWKAKQSAVHAPDPASPGSTNDSAAPPVDNTSSVPTTPQVAHPPSTADIPSAALAPPQTEPISPHFRVPLTDRFNYANLDCSARVHLSHRTAKSPASILSSKKDRYMLSPCTGKGKGKGRDEPQFVVVELCDDIRIDTVQLANFEFFSGIFKDFTVSVAKTYSTDLDGWTVVGTYRAKNIRGVQSFHPPLSLLDFYRYLRIDFHSHYGNEYYCPVSLLRVYGLTHLEQWKWDIWEAESRAKAEEKWKETSKVLVREVEGVEEEQARRAVEVSGSIPLPVPTSIQATVISSQHPAGNATTTTATPAEEVKTHSTDTYMSSSLGITGADIQDPSATGITTSQELEPTPPLKAEGEEDPAASLNSSASEDSNSASVDQNVQVTTTSEKDTETSTAVPSTSPSHSSASAAAYSSTPPPSTAAASSSTPAPSAPTPSAPASSSSSQKSSASPSSASPTAPSQQQPLSSPSPSAIPSPPSIIYVSPLSPPPSPSPPSPLPPSSPPAPETPKYRTPPGGESIYSTIMNRLTALEANHTLFARYIEQQNSAIREVIRRVGEDVGRLEGISRAHAQMYQRNAHDWEKQRKQLQSEYGLLVDRIEYLSEEIILEKRLGIAQLFLLLAVLVFMGLTRGSRGEYTTSASPPVRTVREWGRRHLSFNGEWGRRFGRRSVDDTPVGKGGGNAGGDGKGEEGERRPKIMSAKSYPVSAGLSDRISFPTRDNQETWSKPPLEAISLNTPATPRSSTAHRTRTRTISSTSSQRTPSSRRRGGGGTTQLQLLRPVTPTRAATSAFVVRPAALLQRSNSHGAPPVWLGAVPKSAKKWARTAHLHEVRGGGAPQPPASAGANVGRAPRKDGSPLRGESDMRAGEWAAWGDENREVFSAMPLGGGHRTWGNAKGKGRVVEGTVASNGNGRVVPVNRDEGEGDLWEDTDSMGGSEEDFYELAQ